jgi:hypothetical protein
MRKGLALLGLGLVLLGSACNSDTFGPDPYARQHLITTNVVQCADTTQRLLQVSWVNWRWAAIFLKDSKQVSVVNDSSLTHSSGCVYVAGDKARVKLIPLGDIAKYLDSTFIDVTIK